MEHKINRRDFLRLSALAATSVTLSSCKKTSKVETEKVVATTQPPAGPAPTATPVPIATVMPTTNPVANATLVPTATPVPTDTPVPTAIPTQAIQLEHDPRHYLMDPLIDPPRRYSPVLTITQNKVMNQGMVFREGETIEDNVGYRYIKEIMGIDYKIALACKGETCDQAWATMLASGDIPDYMEWVAGQILGQLMAADQLQDLTDLFPKYASPLTLKKKEWPDSVIWKPLTRCGACLRHRFSQHGRRCTRDASLGA